MAEGDVDGDGRISPEEFQAAADGVAGNLNEHAVNNPEYLEVYFYEVALRKQTREHE